MSAYIVSDKVINNIVSFAFRNDQDYGDKYYYCLFELRELGYLSRKPGQNARFAPKRLGEEMFTLNCDAVEQRYGEGEAEKFRPLNFKCQETSFERQYVYQVLSDISEWLYQCSEGDATENPLYLALKAIKGNIAWQLISNSKEYAATLRA